MVLIMKTTPAIWEKRNLGVESVEFDVELSEGVDIIEDIIRNEGEYNVVRVPAGNTAVLFVLQERGYKFSECMVSLCITAKEFAVLDMPRPQKRIIDVLSYAPADIEALFVELQSGIFTNDRISRDPAFGQALAAKRYWGLISDTLSAGGKAFSVVYKEQDIGFFVNRLRDNGECTGVLFGMYNRWKKSGLGLGGVYMSINQAFRSGARVFTGAVSSNNIDQLRLDLAMGFTVSNLKYILTRHNSQ